MIERQHDPISKEHRLRPLIVFRFYIFISLLGLVLLYSCHPDAGQKPKEQRRPAHTTKLPVAVDPAPVNDNDCVFDTSTYRFTTEAIRRYDPALAFIWDDANKEALMRLNDGDSFRLHIGGCDHFSYVGTYSTAASLFDNDSLLVHRVRWIALNFFNNGFDADIVRSIDHHTYKLESTQDQKVVDLNVSDTTLSDHVYDVVLMRRIGNRTLISVSAYQN